MHGEYPGLQHNQKEQPQDFLADSQDEGKGNVLPFHSTDKPPEHAVEHLKHKSGSHAESVYLLNEMGYRDLDEAKDALSAAREEKARALKAFNDRAMFAIVGKIRDKVFNQGKEQGKEIENIKEIEQKIHRLESAVRFVGATTQLEQGEEYRKAA